MAPKPRRPVAILSAFRATYVQQWSVFKSSRVHLCPRRKLVCGNSTRCFKAPLQTGEDHAVDSFESCRGHQTRRLLHLVNSSGVEFLSEICVISHLRRLERNRMPSQTMGFAGLLEAVPDALVGVDQGGVIRFVNHHTESLFGYERGDLVGAPLET